MAKKKKVAKRSRHACWCGCPCRGEETRTRVYRERLRGLQIAKALGAAA